MEEKDDFPFLSSWIAKFADNCGKRRISKVSFCLACVVESLRCCSKVIHGKAKKKKG